MLTIIGIKAENSDFSIENTVAEVTKTMASEPRRISKIEINFTFQEVYSDKQKKIIEHAAKTCPVWYSLHPDIEKIITFNYTEMQYKFIIMIHSNLIAVILISV